MTSHEFTAGFLFCGLGAGARGFLEAAARLGPDEARFRNLGGVDNDPLACDDFRYLSGGPAVCADLSTMQPTELRAAWGDRRPDAIFLSPPCKGFSGLLSAKSAAAPKYQALNRLVLQGMFLAVETWAAPPPVIIVENVPRITSRGRELLAQVRQLLGGYGYAFHEATHDCGEVGGLAQHRRRYLLVARHQETVPAYIYRPPKRRVRACGEVLGELPLPEDDSAGELHRLPRLSWLNWVRLALIPAGGDWRDLPGMAPRDSAADPSLAEAVGLARTAEGAATFKGRPGLFGVTAWDAPAPTVTGSAKVSGSNAPAAVADPRLSTPLEPGQERRAVWARYDVRPWDAPARTVAGEGSNGGFGVADPRLKCAPRAGSYGIISWQEASATVTGNARVDNGAFAVADPRQPGEVRVPVIIAKDGTWHRPLTTLELAALQGIPAEIDGAPLRLAGRSVARWRERIGNAVPVQAARAVAETILTALLASALGTWTLGATGIWVREDGVTEDAANAEATV